MVVPLFNLEDLLGDLDFFQFPESWMNNTSYFNLVNNFPTMAEYSDRLVYRIPGNTPLIYTKGGTSTFEMKMALKLTGKVSLSPYFHRINYVSKEKEAWNYLGNVHFNGFKSFDELRRVIPSCITLEPPIYRGHIINPNERQRRIKNLTHAKLEDKWSLQVVELLRTFIKEVRELETNIH